MYEQVPQVLVQAVLDLHTLAENRAVELGHDTTEIILEIRSMVHVQVSSLKEDLAPARHSV